VRAFRVLGRDQVALQELPDPEPSPGEVRLRVAANGICHSDVGAVERADVAPYPVPRTLGHETTGWVDRLGPGVRGVEIGAAVGVYSLRSASTRCGRATRATSACPGR
jgi:D-arabinose 1-dehydrogenase-like Zn-dependent alcohol dehydrogenase